MSRFSGRVPLNITCLEGGKRNSREGLYSACGLPTVTGIRGSMLEHLLCKWKVPGLIPDSFRWVEEAQLESLESCPHSQNKPMHVYSDVLMYLVGLAP